MILNILWYFFIYAFLGWCTEVVYAAVVTGKFVNRGFLNGPYCPIYGVGVTLVVFLLSPVKDHVFYMFIGSVLITSAIELIVGFVLEKIFHQKWWDYSDEPFNIGGYICLKFSLIWGVACLVVVDRIQSLVFSLVNIIPHLASEVLLIIFVCLVSLDLIATAKSIFKLNRKLEIIDEITLKIRKASDNMGENLANAAIAFVQKKEDLEENFEMKKEIFYTDIAEIKDSQQKALAHHKHSFNELRKAYKEILETSFFGQKRLLKAFPGLRHMDYKDALEKLRKTILNGLSTSNETETNKERDETKEKTNFLIC